MVAFVLCVGRDWGWMYWFACFVSSFPVCALAFACYSSYLVTIYIGARERRPRAGGPSAKQLTEEGSGWRFFFAQGIWEGEGGEGGVDLVTDPHGRAHSLGPHLTA